MRVAAVADLHGQLPAVPPCDLLVLGGDLTPLGDHAPEVQAAFLDGPFRAWLEGCGAPEVVAVAGNHDFVLERAPELVPDDLPWTYLQDAAATVAGLRVWGSPWTPWFYDWAFNAPRDGGEAFLAERFAGCPQDVDVLVVHGPPAGFGDRTTGGLDVGSAAQLELVDRAAPRLHVFGHIHEGRGTWRRGPTTLVNAAALDGAFAPVPDPVVVVDL